jgi:hypothetical protein
MFFGLLFGRMLLSLFIVLLEVIGLGELLFKVVLSEILLLILLKSFISIGFLVWDRFSSPPQILLYDNKNIH